MFIFQYFKNQKINFEKDANETTKKKINYYGFYIIKKYCEQIKLFITIKSIGFFNEKLIILCIQDFNAMNYYDYTIKLIHRNLKQENIIIESINPEKYFYNITIIDFVIEKNLMILMKIKFQDVVFILLQKF